MKSIRALAVTAALLAYAPAAHAQVLDLSKTSCKELIDSGKDGLIIIWSWLYSYYADQDADPGGGFRKTHIARTKTGRVLRQKPVDRRHHRGRADLRQVSLDSPPPA
jgi:hypothetical protein